MKAGVIVFPGSNCDRDASVALLAAGAKVVMIWHAETALPTLDLVVLPGGFSYGDYLRCGAISAHAPIMKEVKRHAEAGRYVLGICNGFQVLTETGLLPGVLMRNKNLKFICRDTFLRVETSDSVFTGGYKKGVAVAIPIAHHDGNYFTDKKTLKILEDEDRIAFRYADAGGAVNDNANPNGALRNIAGILNERRNVLGMMPHPERAADSLTAGEDGKTMFESLIKALG